VRPAENYWSRLEDDAVELTARTLLIDEPLLSGDPGELEGEELKRGFSRLRSTLPGTRLVLTAAPQTFSRAALPLAMRLPVDALLLDLVARPQLLVEAMAIVPPGIELIAADVAEAPR
jgi:hypothetical protein